MPALPRTSLASLVCPSAPFLAPRLLRSYAPLAALPSQPWRAAMPARRAISDMKHLKMVQNRKRQALMQQHLYDQATVLDQFRNACRDRNLRSLMDLYPSMKTIGTLTRDDTRRIAQTLHACSRNPQLLTDTRTHLLAFVQQLVQDLQKGAIPAHPFVFVHILGLYKERRMFDEGHSLWQWLARQDDSYVSQAVYGAAIELLAWGKKLNLPELEALYLDALKRFPGTFAEYHLSPDAIVPNRAQPIAIANVPITLLQGILTARILYNDSQKAYLALDTALRLYPSQLPPRFFEIFIDSRQLREAYTVFLVACRAGVVVRPSHVTNLLSKTRASIKNCDSLRDRIVLVRAIANALYAYLEAGGSLSPIHVGQFLTSFSSLLPEPTVGSDYEGEMASLRNRIVTFAHGALSSLLQAGMPPSPQVFNALITLAGTLRVPDLLRVSLQDADTAQVDLDAIGLRGVMTSAGKTGAKDIIEEYWTRTAHEAALNGSQMDQADWITFGRACKRADHISFFHAQLREQEHAIPAFYKDSIVAVIDEYEPAFSKTIDILSSEEFDGQLAELQQQIKNIAAVTMSGQRLDIKSTPFYMSLDPEKLPLGKLEDMRTIYDEYTLDPHQPPPPASILPSALSPTGIPLDDLRFANWTSILELMDQASNESSVETKNPLKGGRTSLLILKYLRDYIKKLRGTSVGQLKIRKHIAQKLITPSPRSDGKLNNFRIRYLSGSTSGADSAPAPAPAPASGSISIEHSPVQPSESSPMTHSARMKSGNKTPMSRNPLGNRGEHRTKPSRHLERPNKNKEESTIAEEGGDGQNTTVEASDGANQNKSS